MASIAAAGAPAVADTTTAGGDSLRTGWYPNQPALTPALVGDGAFGQLFSTPVTGQVYGQPLVSNGVLFVTTEDNWIYGLDPVTGAVKWQRNVGTPVNASDVGCPDLSPHVGITATPVIDPSGSGTAYFTAKTYEGDGSPVYYMHGVDLATGAERANFPAQISGTAQNDSTRMFNAKFQLQRPGLLLMGGVVYAAFGGLCDIRPYQGWVFGISTTSGATTARWVAIGGGSDGAAIWQSGGGLVSDGPGRILLATGNSFDGGTPPPGTPGTQPPDGLGESLVRLNVQGNGQLEATDFFAPYNADSLDSVDRDFGSGAPIALPPQFGTESVPDLAIAAGKEGYLYLLDRSNLGGIAEGPNGTDSVVQRIGPYNSVLSRPAVWPGDGGYVYYTMGNLLRVFQYGVDGDGKPSLSLAASSTDAFAYVSSGPVVTSNGTASGSAIVWIIRTPVTSGQNAQLRAYLPVSSGAYPTLIWSAPIGISSKFNPPGVGDNRIYVGTADGHVIGFGGLSGTAAAAASAVAGVKVPTLVARVTRLSLRSRTIKAERLLTVSYSLSQAARVQFRFERGRRCRRSGRCGRYVATGRTVLRAGKKGRNRIRLRAPRRAGSYRLRLTPETATGSKGTPRRVHFRVR